MHQHYGKDVLRRRKIAAAWDTNEQLTVEMKSYVIRRSSRS